MYKVTWIDKVDIWILVYLSYLLIHQFDTKFHNQQCLGKYSKMSTTCNRHHKPFVENRMTFSSTKKQWIYLIQYFYANPNTLSNPKTSFKTLESPLIRSNPQRKESNPQNKTQSPLEESEPTRIKSSSLYL